MMYRLWGLLGLLALMLIPACSANPAPAMLELGAHRVAVLPFTTRADSSVGDDFAQALSDKLNLTGRFEALGPRELTAKLGEQGYSNLLKLDPMVASSALAEKLNVQAVIAGRVVAFLELANPHREYSGSGFELAPFGQQLDDLWTYYPWNSRFCPYWYRGQVDGQYVIYRQGQEPLGPMVIHTTKSSIDDFPRLPRELADKAMLQAATDIANSLAPGAEVKASEKPRMYL